MGAPAARATVTGDGARRGLGTTVRSAGDVDGDGRDDLVVGSWFDDGDGGDRRGSLWLVLDRRSR